MSPEVRSQQTPEVVPLLKAQGKNPPSCLPQLLKFTQDAELWIPSSVFKAVV